jgi:hypothetical protein
VSSDYGWGDVFVEFMRVVGLLLLASIITGTMVQSWERDRVAAQQRVEAEHQTAVQAAQKEEAVRVAAVQVQAAGIQSRHPTWDSSLCTEIAKCLVPHSGRGGLSEKLVVQHPDWPWATITAQEVVLGMTGDMVKASWGDPYDINRSVGSWGVHEQWVYGDTWWFGSTLIDSRRYLYFENGILTSWQD